MKILPARRSRRPLVAALVYDGIGTFELGIVIEVFGLPRPEQPDWYRFLVCAIEPGPLRAVGGLTIAAPGGLADLRRADLIIVPGWRAAREPPPARLLDAIRAAHRRGARVASICSGVFVLAAAGLLAGRRATTHWRYTAALAQQYPDICVEPDVLYVDEGSILTSAGSAAGLDLCLHIVRRDRGARVANQVARRLVIPPHREGGQKQFLDRPVPEAGEPAFAAMFDWARAHLDRAIPVATLARRAHMSLRTFMRRFHAATGTSPGRWLLLARLARARELLETTALDIERVTAACGFGSADTLRHHFRRELRTSPSRYRATFRGR